MSENSLTVSAYLILIGFFLALSLIYFIANRFNFKILNELTIAMFDFKRQTEHPSV